MTDIARVFVVMWEETGNVNFKIESAKKSRTRKKAEGNTLTFSSILVTLSSTRPPASARDGAGPVAFFFPNTRFMTLRLLWPLNGVFEHGGHYHTSPGFPTKCSDWVRAVSFSYFFSQILGFQLPDARLYRQGLRSTDHTRAYQPQTPGDISPDFRLR